MVFNYSELKHFLTSTYFHGIIRVTIDHGLVDKRDTDYHDKIVLFRRFFSCEIY